MESQGSVTRWLGQLQDGNVQAAFPLWDRYFRRLVGLARKKLGGRAPAVADEEDVALSAFDSLCRQVEQGRLPHLEDRDGLWRILAVMTVRKAAHLVRDETRQKRGGQAKFVANLDDSSMLNQVLSREPTPELVVQFADEFERLLQLLGDPELAQVAQRRLEGSSVEEIAGQLGYASRSIKRKLQLIRTIWEKEIGP
jgi:DNA-directed RNA polymerase specialized sigma24 family protein